MENIIEKLDQEKNNFDNWNIKEIQKLLDIYLIISKKEDLIFNLIYRFHGCDSWEDVFRDYNVNYLRDKVSGIEVAINAIKRFFP
jgi:hypothetical protein